MSVAKKKMVLFLYASLIKHTQTILFFCHRHVGWVTWQPLALLAVHRYPTMIGIINSIQIDYSNRVIIPNKYCRIKYNSKDDGKEGNPGARSSN